MLSWVHGAFAVYVCFVTGMAGRYGAGRRLPRVLRL
jgi:hypothetical protein